jgi:sialic acid synthase SpsE
MGQSQSAANLTVVVFNQVSSAQSYFARFRSNVQGLPGYSNLSSVVNGYQQYGACYGYGEDVDGIAVVVGICTKGNVFLEVHITSSNDFSSTQGDLANLMGAAYSNVS